MASQYGRRISFVVRQESLACSNEAAIRTWPEVYEAIEVRYEIGDAPLSRKFEVCSEQWALVFKDNSALSSLNDYLAFSAQ